MLIAYARPRPMYIVLTNHRILFVEQEQALGGVGKKILMSLERAAVTVAQTGKGMLGLTMRVQLEINGEEKGLQITFPHASKTDGRKLIAALPTS
jgi:hypothetical protein